MCALCPSASIFLYLRLVCVYRPSICPRASASAAQTLRHICLLTALMSTFKWMPQNMLFVFRFCFPLFPLHFHFIMNAIEGVCSGWLLNLLCCRGFMLIPCAYLQTSSKGIDLFLLLFVLVIGIFNGSMFV